MTSRRFLILVRTRRRRMSRVGRRRAAGVRSEHAASHIDARLRRGLMDVDGLVPFEKIGKRRIHDRPRLAVHHAVERVLNSAHAGTCAVGNVRRLRKTRRAGFDMDDDWGLVTADALSSLHFRRGGKVETVQTTLSRPGSSWSGQ